ncbi:MAG: lyase family protein [bacterium]
MKREAWVKEAINEMVGCGAIGRVRYGQSNMTMPSDGRYQPSDLRPYLGYDQWASWLIIVEWAWLKTLAKKAVIPVAEASLLRPKLLSKMLQSITTTDQDSEEAKTKHDIIALTNLMKLHLPLPLHKWLHYCATSYDIICTAYALQYQVTFEQVLLPKMLELDQLWCKLIEDHAEVLQAGRTHLQTALPITVGFWLAQLHNRYVRNCRTSMLFADLVEGKFSGAVGTYASQVVMLKDSGLEKNLMQTLGLNTAPISTQISPPESMQEAYHSLMLLSGSLANLGEDVRILQSSAYQELISTSSTSSAMSHKTANPIAAEQLLGMHRTVISEYMLIAMNMVSDLQRDLSNSSCMRRYSSIMVYVYQQLLTAERLLKSLKVNIERCQKNLGLESHYLTAEILHLSMGLAGLPAAHEFVNEKIIGMVQSSGCSLADAMDIFCENSVDNNSKAVGAAWGKVPEEVKSILYQPELYIGKAKELAKLEAKNYILR